jgi:small subunit ribosomal protein S7
MARRKIIVKKKLLPDPIYGSSLFTKYVGKLLKEGKKERAMKILYKALEESSTKLRLKPLEVLETATENCRPLVEVRARRIGGATYQIPMEVPYERGITLSVKWIVGIAKGKKGKPIHRKLAEEFTDAVNKTGASFKKREDTHKMAEANKAFSHFRW